MVEERWEARASTRSFRRTARVRTRQDATTLSLVLSNITNTNFPILEGNCTIHVDKHGWNPCPSCPLHHFSPSRPWGNFVPEAFYGAAALVPRNPYRVSLQTISRPSSTHLAVSQLCLCSQCRPRAKTGHRRRPRRLRVHHRRRPARTRNSQDTPCEHRRHSQSKRTRSRTRRVGRGYG